MARVVSVYVGPHDRDNLDRDIGRAQFTGADSYFIGERRAVRG